MCGKDCNCDQTLGYKLALENTLVEVERLVERIEEYEINIQRLKRVCKSRGHKLKQAKSFMYTL